MNTIRSQLNTSSGEYTERRENCLHLLGELRSRLLQASRAGSQESLALSAERKKFTTAERISLLIDPGCPLLDIGPLAGLDIDGNTDPGAGIVTCIANIAGRRCVIVANNPAVKGGTYFPMTVKKHLRAQEIAEQNHLPCIYLVDSGGAFLPLQDQVFPDRFHFGRIFFNQARMSAQGIPQISVVLGSSTAGGAYVPAMSDETIMVRGNATIFLGGPPLVKAATGEEVSAEELGGAEVHCTISGVADHLAEDEEHAFMLAREAVAALGPDRVPRLIAEQKPEAPLYDPEELYGIIGGDPRKSFPMREVLARTLDGSRFHEFKATYGATLLCGFGHIQGYLVGILANDGILFSESALKAAHFIQLCNQRNVPLVFFQNITGFMVGKSHEHQGIAKHGAKMVSAVATSRVPKFTVIVGGSFGAGNYGMCGRAYDPHFLFTWPNSRISVMGGAQAARVLTDIKRSAAARKGSGVNEAELEKYHAAVLEKYELEGSPYYASAHLWDDGIIDPAQTRNVLAQAFGATYIAHARRYQPGIFRM